MVYIGERSHTVFGDLIGRVLDQIDVNADQDEVRFSFADGTIYLMHHEQDCCESVRVEEVVGSFFDLLGSPLLDASEQCSREEVENDDGTRTWTFYRFSTIKGTVVIRWLGASNGYYSESVDFERVSQ